MRILGAWVRDTLRCALLIMPRNEAAVPGLGLESQLLQGSWEHHSGEQAEGLTQLLWPGILPEQTCPVSLRRGAWLGVG